MRRYNANTVLSLYAAVAAVDAARRRAAARGANAVTVRAAAAAVNNAVRGVKNG